MDGAMDDGRLYEKAIISKGKEAIKYGRQT